ncbi:hypothetical protein [Pseudomonas fluorescens]|uniref:hypothetical protein n=1 Tax=Pseudomonas fluorescens TaxID=294 RepID=UPI001242C903|nr:hypothetical protein [Pseudomonas fluorescens]
MKAKKLNLSLWIWLLPITALANSGDDLKCSDAIKIGEKAYDRTEVAYNAGAKDSAILYSKSFWDIYDSNRNCTYLKYLASKLEVIGITQSSLASCDSSNITSGNSNKIISCHKKPQTNETEPPSGGGGAPCISMLKKGSRSHVEYIAYMEKCDPL